jgi:deoxycytidylate deaminase
MITGSSLGLATMAFLGKWLIYPLNANGSVKKGTLFTYPFPCCASCSAMMIQAGIKHVVSPDHIPERWRDSVEMGISMYREADVKVTLL